MIFPMFENKASDNSWRFKEREELESRKGGLARHGAEGGP